ncbi:hypothetical protein [Sphingomonas lycopersici]|uniref:Lipoprotein n=1 Tax=Sphingomonas lycopersici TaxID=2951807 RepID=A0AA42CWF5_9SPHN|nr:hypothetical protein [Sphingomonas lycopersici]MCW6537771.1 hypothetical protein [Sphingomonas lycopersici]
MTKRSSVIARASIAAAGLSLALAGCAASRERISLTLQDYGLDQRRANCASDFLHGHLSDRQLDRLSRAAVQHRGGYRRGPMTFGDLLRISAALGDANIPLSVGAAAVACGVAGDMPLPRF